MSEIKNLKPECIWRNFYALTQVPRPSGHLEKIQQFLLDFAAKAGVGLRFVRDLEQGKQTLRMDKINQVLALFGKEVGAVMKN